MKRLAFALVALMLLATVVYAGAWFYWAQQVTGQIERTKADLAAQGTVVEGTFTPVGGFPGPLVIGFSGRISNGVQGLVLPELRVRSFFLPGTVLNIDMPRGARAQVPEWDEFSSTLDELKLTGRIPAPLPASFTARDLFVWQSQGGKIEVTAMDLRKGMLHIHGKGEIALDERLQPVMTMPVEMTGHMDFLVDLQKRGVVNNRNSLIAGAVLAGLSRSGPDGKQILPINLSIQKSTLYTGPIRIMDVPPLFWPE